MDGETWAPDSSSSGGLHSRVLSFLAASMHLHLLMVCGNALDTHLMPVLYQGYEVYRAALCAEVVVMRHVNISSRFEK